MVLRIFLFHQLPLVVTISEKLQVLEQGLQMARKTTGFSCQSLQIMSQVCVDCFHRIGFLFVRAHFVGCSIIQVIVGGKGITIVLSRLGGTFQTGLEVDGASLADCIPTEQTVCCSIYHGQNIDFVFFCFKKVYNSSNSATFGLWGIGVGGN